MADAKKQSAPKHQRGLLARPLDSLMFLLPLMIFFQVAFLLYPDSLSAHPRHVIAFSLVLRFFELFGQFGMWAPGIAVVIILLATHAASGEAWTIHMDRVAFMYAESMLLSIPLLTLNWAIPLAGLSTGVERAFPSTVETVALGIGAGVYEELVFRLFLISIVVVIGVDLVHAPRSTVAAIAVALSALVFAAHHHQPFGDEAFNLERFMFRTMAGIYLAIVFWFRGYGSSAGCHAAYNVALAVAG